MVIIIVGREYAVTGLRSIASAEGLTIAASRLGKSKMVAQVACCSFLIAGSRYPGGDLLLVGTILLWGVMVLSILSMWHYFQSFWGRIGENVKTRESQEKKQQELDVLPGQNKHSDALINT
jgi:CDP-diacylglycerol--glycerol-3-phosphate 3-phosphatidyltransferase